MHWDHVSTPAEATPVCRSMCPLSSVPADDPFTPPCPVLDLKGHRALVGSILASEAACLRLPLVHPCCIMGGAWYLVVMPPSMEGCCAAICCEAKYCDGGTDGRVATCLDTSTLMKVGALLQA